MVKVSQPPYNHIKSEVMGAQRVAGTEYVNTTGRTLFVNILIRIEITTGGETATITGGCSITPGGAWFYPQIVGYHTTPAIAHNIYGMINMTILPGCKYKLFENFSTNTYTLANWLESY